LSKSSDTTVQGTLLFMIVVWFIYPIHLTDKANFSMHQKIKRFEKNRLNMLFDLLKETMKEKPNRIMGTGYSQFLDDGKLYIMRGETR